MKVGRGIWVALLGVVACAAGPATGKVEKVCIPVVRSAEQAPVVDGVIRDSEWKYGASLTGLVSHEGGAFAQRQGTVRYVCDGANLYIGLYAPSVPAGTVPEVKAGPPYDGKGYMDFAGNDRVEINVVPPNDREVGEFYFVGDAAGHTYVEHFAGGQHKAIRPEWDYRTSFDENGWTVEIRIPLAVLGQKGPLGQAPWRLNATFARLFPLKYEGLAGNPHATVTAVPAADIPAVQFERLGDLPKGKLDLGVTLREYEGVVATPKEGAYDERAVESGGLTLQSKGKVARVSWALLDADGKTVAQDARIVALAPARMVPLAFARDFKPGPQNTLKLAVETADAAQAFEAAGDAAKITTLYAATLPFKPYDDGEAKQWQERVLKGTVFGSWRFVPAFFPYWEKAKVQAVFFKGRVRDQAAKLRVTITSDKGFRAQREVPVVDGVMVGDAPYPKLLDIPIPGLPAGIYTTRGEVLDAGGKVVATEERTYERKRYPWEHNSLGLSRGVIKPWTPMQVKDGEVACWGRTQKVGFTGLPEQLVSQQKPLLAGPVTLELRDRGNAPLVLRSTSPAAFTEQAQDRVRWQGQGTVGQDVAVTVTGLAEYDGFSWYEVTLTPARPLEVASGHIVISLPEREAQLMHFQSCWARDNFSGAIPALPAGARDAETVVFRSLDTKNYGRTGGFSPHVWIGNLTRGLSWFADSDEGWSSAPDKSALEIVRAGDQVRLVMNIITRPVTLAKPRTIRFGLMATPFKPLMPIKDMPLRAVNWLGTDNKTLVQAHMYGLYPPNFDYALIDKHLPGWRLYFNKHEMGAALPERATFDNEWGGMEPAADYPGAPERFGPGVESRAINRPLTDSRIDMTVYYIGELAKKTKMGGTYWDITGIGAGLPMLENGTAYVDPESGELRNTFDILKSRQLFKRVATMWQEIRGEPDIMEVHSTNHMGIPFYSFAYQWLNFEWLWPNPNARRPDRQWQDFIDLRPLDLFATEGVPSQFGVWISSINGGDRPDDPAEFRRVARSAVALGSLHNHFTGHVPTIGPRDRVDFVGYWDEARRVTTDHELVRASYWRQANKVEVVVVNLGLDDCKATVRLALATLGWIQAGLSAEITGEEELESRRDSLTQGGKQDAAKAAEAVLTACRAARRPPEVRVADGALNLTFDLPSHDYRVFTVEGQSR